MRLLVREAKNPEKKAQPPYSAWLDCRNHHSDTVEAKCWDMCLCNILQHTRNVKSGFNYEDMFQSFLVFGTDNILVVELCNFEQNRSGRFYVPIWVCRHSVLV